MVSSIHDFTTAATGHNYVTGDDVGLGGRAVAVAGLVTPFGGGQIRAAGKVIRRVTGDFVERAIGRGVRPADIMDALRNPVKVREVKIDPKGQLSQQIIGRRATVVQNPETADLVTVWKTSSKKVKSN